MRVEDSPQWWESAVISQQIKSTVNTGVQTVWSSSGCNISMNSGRPSSGKRRKPQRLSEEERVAWVGTTAHFRHSEVIASFSSSAYLPHKKLMGG